MHTIPPTSEVSADSAVRKLLLGVGVFILASRRLVLDLSRVFADVKSKIVRPGEAPPAELAVIEVP